MVLMTKIKQEDYLNNIERRLSLDSVGLIADALEEEGDRVVSKALNGNEAEDEQTSYSTYLFEGETSPYSVFQKAVMAAGKCYAESDCKIADLTAQNRAIQRATDAFIVASQQGEYQIDQAFFDDYQPEFFTHIYENEETFIQEAIQKAEQVFKPLEEKLGFKSEEIQNQFRKEDGFIERNTLGRELRALGFSWSDYANAYEVDIKVKEEKAKLSKAESALFDCKILSEIYDDKGHNNQFLPFTLFARKAFNAITIYAYSEHSPEDLAAFKKGIESATDACVQHYQTKVEPGVLDYIKAVGLALVGAIIGLATFPAVIVSSDYRGWLGHTFFSGVSPTFVDNDESKAIKAAVKDGTLTDDILNWQAPVPGA